MPQDKYNLNFVEILAGLEQGKEYEFISDQKWRIEVIDDRLCVNPKSVKNKSNAYRLLRNITLAQLNRYRYREVSGNPNN